MVVRASTVREEAPDNMPQFLDYLRSGWQFNMCVAVDFTSSNGEISDPTSLHHTGVAETPYEKVIKQCGEIVAPYDYND